MLQTHPDHAGALHYLIHNYDDPEHAAEGLAAARRLAALAPDSSHARHMPAHVFLQLGMWREAAASDRAAFDQSTAWIERRHFGPAVRNYHALTAAQTWICTVAMLVGRLEIFSVIVLFTPAFWRK